MVSERKHTDSLNNKIEELDTKLKHLSYGDNEQIEVDLEELKRDRIVEKQKFDDCKRKMTEI